MELKATAPDLNRDDPTPPLPRPFDSNPATNSSSHSSRRLGFHSHLSSTVNEFTPANSNSPPPFDEKQAMQLQQLADNFDPARSKGGGQFAGLLGLNQKKQPSKRGEAATRPNGPGGPNSKLRDNDTATGSGTNSMSNSSGKNSHSGMIVNGNLSSDTLPPPAVSQSSHSASNLTSTNSNLLPCTASSPAPFRTLSRSPSFEKKLIESARAAGTEGEVEQGTRSFSWNPISIFCIIFFILVGVGVSIFIYFYLRGLELNGWRSSFNTLCSERTKTVQNSLSFAVSILQAYGGFVALYQSQTERSHSQFTSGDFTLFANATGTFTLLDTVVYTPIITNATRAAYESQFGSIDSIACYIVNCTDGRYYLTPRTWKNPNGSPITQYLPIQFMTPNFTPSLLNLDLWILPGRGNDILKSIALGSVVAGPRSTLFGGRGYGILVQLPLYQTPTVPSTLDERMSSGSGAILGVLPIPRLMNDAISELDEQPIEVRLYDLQASRPSDELVSTAQPQDDSNQGEVAIIPFVFGARNYEIQCLPSNGFVQSAYGSTPIFIATGAGILFAINILMFAMALMWLSMRRAVQRGAILAHANRNKNLALDLLDQAKLVADDANRSKSDFLAFLCHELRNPLHAIGATVNFLHQSSMSESDWECVETIESQFKIMQAIVNDALDLSKIEAAKLKFETVPFNLADLVADLLAGQRPRATAKGLDLVLNVDESIPPVVYGDPTRITQVITNLISNSIKFTSLGMVEVSVQVVTWDDFASRGLPIPENVAKYLEWKAKQQQEITRLTNENTKNNISFPNPNILLNATANSGSAAAPHSSGGGSGSGTPANASLSLSRVNGLSVPTNAGISRPYPPGSPGSNSFSPYASLVPIEIRVVDTGTGIDDDALPHLFEPYSQAKLSIMRLHGGTGLGLSIVKKIMELLHGSVSVSSEVGKGSTFVLRFSLAVTEEAAVEEQMKREQHERSKEARDKYNSTQPSTSTSGSIEVANVKPGKGNKIKDQKSSAPALKSVAVLPTSKSFETVNIGNGNVNIYHDPTTNTTNTNFSNSHCNSHNSNSNSYSNRDRFVSPLAATSKLPSVPGNGVAPHPGSRSPINFQIKGAPILASSSPAESTPQIRRNSASRSDSQSQFENVVFHGFDVMC